MSRRLLFAIMVLAAIVPSTNAAEIIQLTADNIQENIPQGKEVDAIIGDYLLRNDKIVAIVANPIEGRNVHLTCRENGGCLIDLTRLDVSNDQLTAYMPRPRGHVFRVGKATKHDDGSVSFMVSGPRAENGVRVTSVYTLRDGMEAIEVKTTYLSHAEQDVEVRLVEELRADFIFRDGRSQDGTIAWMEDPWWKAAYGFVSTTPDVLPDFGADSGGRSQGLIWKVKGEPAVTLKTGERFELKRLVYPSAGSMQLQTIVTRTRDDKRHEVKLTVLDDNGVVANAGITVRSGDTEIGFGQTNDNGQLIFTLPAGQYEADVNGLSRNTKTLPLDVSGSIEREISLDTPGVLVANIKDKAGRNIPCKVQFIGKDGTKTPFFFPSTGEEMVHNCHHSHNGQFLQLLAEGTYDLIISYGNEYDAVFLNDVKIVSNQKTPIEATLVRTVDTRGWVSADYHSHSSPSGDNPSSQRGRVLTHLVEQIEFAPCTEHQRFDSYDAILKELNATKILATCVGIELTGRPGSANHQNAFPFKEEPFTQDGGGPRIFDEDPKIQIERLAYWQGDHERLIQQNHPDINEVFYDRDKDGLLDFGMGTAPFMDVIEVHPLDPILQPRPTNDANAITGNRMLDWMKTINDGYRVTGVVNTDAHYNFHGVGWLRNYVKSSTDDPADISVLEMVRQSEAGHVVMTSGPFLEVTMKSASDGGNGKALPGDDLHAPQGKVTATVKVQCPNWMDINRIQVFINGSAEPSLNFTRKSHEAMFGDGVVKFNHDIKIELDRDAHIIIVAAGEGLTLGPVMGPQMGKNMPIAVSNPVFVDVEGDGFTPLSKQ